MISAIVLAVMVVFSIFIYAENSRNNGTNISVVAKADNIAANVFQYQDSITRYVIANYDDLHLAVLDGSGSVAQITPIDYIASQISKYNQKNLELFLNYKSVVFNYSKEVAVESSSLPILYVASSWNNYLNVANASYENIRMLEVMSKLGAYFAKHLYQGDSAYWTIPWVFSQRDCQIIEFYGQLPLDSNGNSQLGRLKNVFNDICTQIQANSGYIFMTYVYIAPIFPTPDV